MSSADVSKSPDVELGLQVGGEGQESPRLDVSRVLAERHVRDVCHDELSNVVASDLA